MADHDPTMTDTDLLPTCPDCGREAPSPHSEAAFEWRVFVSADGLPLTMCPDCAAASERIQQAFHQARRQRRWPPDRNDLVSVGGAEKRFRECSREEVLWLAAEAGRRAQREFAWADWHETLASAH